MMPRDAVLQVLGSTCSVVAKLTKSKTGLETFWVRGFLNLKCFLDNSVANCARTGLTCITFLSNERLRKRPLLSPRALGVQQTVETNSFWKCPD